MPNLNVSGGDSAFYFVPAGSRARIARPRRTVDPRDDLGGNTRVACAIRRRMGIGHENRGPERDQRIGPQARQTLAPLPLRPITAPRQVAMRRFNPACASCMVITGRTSLNSKAMGSESERFAPGCAPTQRFCSRRRNGKRAGA